jgi:CheY-like chemotaxis protein
MDALTDVPQLRVLVVDDCPDTTGSFAELLKLWGHDVRVAADGPTALESARRYGPHVVLLDIGLPGAMDGFEVARRLRHLPDVRWRTIVICISGYGRDEDHRHSRLAGCDYHFVKPPDPEELQRLLDAAKAELRERRLRRMKV